MSKNRHYLHTNISVPTDPNLASATENIGLFKEIRKESEYLKKEVKDKYRLGNLVGKSEEMQSIFNQIEIFSKCDASILIEGETGTGKELVARAIHCNGQRIEKSFVPVECGAIPETLAESELFGYKKGTFTDAKEDKPGLFEEADSGTLFFDQIENMSSKIQAKLLRFLQEGEIRRLGDTKPTKVDVRVISAINIDLKEKVREGSFREDLYFRLNTLSIYIPPLRDRRDDIPIIIDYYLNLFSYKNEKNVKGVSKKALNYLLNYNWPGNIRELEHMIEKGFILTKCNEIIQLESLLNRERKPSNKDIESIPDGIPLKKAVEILEKRRIEKALEINKWNLTKASESLGLTREGLRKKMGRYSYSTKITTERL
jgi:transcriptional regulator with PAS, ATPase and Fis domain